MGAPCIFSHSFLHCFSFPISQLCSKANIYFPVFPHNPSYLNFLLLCLNSTSCFEASLRRAHISNRHNCLVLKLDKQTKTHPLTKKGVLKIGCFGSTQDEAKLSPPSFIHGNCWLFFPLQTCLSTDLDFSILIDTQKHTFYKTLLMLVWHE